MQSSVKPRVILFSLVTLGHPRASVPLLGALRTVLSIFKELFHLLNCILEPVDVPLL